jgi:hypothetical protein
MFNGVEYKHLILFDNDHQQTKTYNPFPMIGGRIGHDGMVVGFTATYAICAYHHEHCEL